MTQSHQTIITHNKGATHSINLGKSERAWLSSFQQSSGRPLRVLHIGNVANNAYINAKLQRKIGIDAFVVAETDTYIMDQPEWEDADFNGDWGDDFTPSWDKVDLKGYQRPLWFITGNLYQCLEKSKFEIYPTPHSTRKLTLTLIRRIKLKFLSLLLHLFIAPLLIIFYLVFLMILAPFQRLFQNGRYFRYASLEMKLGVFSVISIIITVFPIRYNKEKIIKRYDKFTSFFSSCKTKILSFVNSFSKKKGFEIYRKKLSILQDINLHDYIKRLVLGKYIFINSLVEKFKSAFPNRKDCLRVNDLLPFFEIGKTWQEIFSSYDIIQCYGAHPIWGLLANSNKPYVSLEHGTLRDFTMGDVGIHRLISLAYKESKHTFITNGDCLEYAQKLGLEPFSPMIHPLDLEPFRTEENEAVSALRQKYNAEILLFCPIRHDWEIKGVDKCIKSLPLIIKQVDKRVKLVLCAWGKEIDRSKKLIKALGVEDNVIWVRPLPKIPLARHIKAADVVLDQMALPHFGGTAPQSLAAGTPVIMSYRPESTAWMFAKPAPILAAFTPEQIADCAIKALEKEWLHNFKIIAKEWVDAYHSPEFLLNSHVKVYRDILTKGGSSLHTNDSINK